MRGDDFFLLDQIGLSYGLINSQFGIVCDFSFINSSITKVYLKLNDQNPGKKAMLKDLYMLNHQLELIQMVETNI